MSNFVTNVLKLVSGSVTAQVLGIILIPIITRIYNPDDFNYLTVFDLGKKQYRTVNLNTVKEVKANKETLTF